jgi:hypothetical protein
VETRLLIRTVDEADLAVADGALALKGLFVDEDQAVVACVGDYEQVVVKTFLLLDAEELPRVAQVAVEGSLLVEGELFGLFLG